MKIKVPLSNKDDELLFSATDIAKCFCGRDAKNTIRGLDDEDLHTNIVSTKRR
ncbi:hypothetical protein [Clostridium butyricum]|uniref:hypothetical protein n=1 Tax=Clostridium butyricum TaxID=1492 RepID=UPI0013D7EDC2|nr:hypothetical protein [Clostridium butyricum]MCQ2017856.1 hypothetical protein [Clostridium butyricum]MCQ2021682.1 hypothetical protein [Clostridium butyricum]UTY52881.1 hypothetical protein HNS01_07160 [Clostridium butyricum]